VLVGCGAAILALAVPPAATADRDGPLTALSIEELADLEVTTVSRRAEPWQRAAAAVYVITREEIARSGVTSIPEALRLAPGVEVARLDTHTWSISIRGFNSTTANKLLVLLDGRSLYTPLYSGVFWDVQDTLLADVERIEVVAGPGGSLWGANAVNGVINIITRSAAQTAGGLIEMGAGEEERRFGAARYGARIGERAHARGYVKGLRRDDDAFADGGDAGNAWRMTQGGFRVDWSDERDALTAQGDAYSGELENGATDVGGANLLARWSRRQAAGGFQLQAYWDRTDRRVEQTFEAHRDTYDLDLQHELTRGRRHQLVWGLGYRLTADDIGNTDFVAFLPARRRDQLWSAFAQDEIALFGERLAITLGAKLERNDYTGLEVQPNVRLAWLPGERQTWWAAVSRAVRTPSRLDSDVVLTSPLAAPTVPMPVPVVVVVRGSDDFGVEKLVAYESGYRVQPSDRLALDLAAFYNDYTDLRSLETEAPVLVPSPSPRVELPVRLGNRLAGRTSGATLAARWTATPRLVVRSSYTYLDCDFRAAAASRDVSSARQIEGSSPRHQLAAAAQLSLPRAVHLAATFRHVDELPAVGVDSYSSLDLALGWQAGTGVELSLVGQNLLDARHREFVAAGSRQLERGFYARVEWRF
jgi:iron complex outermembrane receptor protein